MNAAMKITIVTANMQSGVATTGGYWHYGFTGWRYGLPHGNKPMRVAGEAFRREDVDIACIQEISESSLRTGWTSQTAALADAAGMPGRHFYLTARFDGYMKEGNAIIAKGDLNDIVYHPLTGGILRSALGEAKAVIGGKEITVFVAHTSLGRELRRKQIGEIVELLKGRSGPVILCGDFNETNPMAFDELRRITSFKQMCSLPTYPSWKPTRPLDYIFLSEHFKILDCYIPKGRSFSDHAAMVVRAEL